MGGFQQAGQAFDQGMFKVPIPRVVETILFFKAQAISQGNYEGSKGLTRLLAKITAPYHDGKMAEEEAQVGTLLATAKHKSQSQANASGLRADAEYWADEEMIAVVMRMLGRNNLVARGDETMQF